MTYRCYNEIRVPFKKELSYKLHTTVFQGLSDNSYLTLWALRQLRRRSRGSFVYSYETKIEFVDDQFKEQAERDEIDFFALKEGKIIIGEVKENTDGFQRELGKWRNFVLKLKPCEFYLVFNVENISSFIESDVYINTKKNLEKEGIVFKTWARRDLIPDDTNFNNISNIPLR